MPRPRVYEPDRVLDAVESLAVASGPAAVTIRAISAAVGVSNGAFYHTFESRSGLMGRAWLRAGRRFLAVQNDLVDKALSQPDRKRRWRPWSPQLTLPRFSPSSIRAPPKCC